MSRVVFRELRQLRAEQGAGAALSRLQAALAGGELGPEAFERAGRLAAELMERPARHVRLLGQCTVEWLAWVMVAVALSEGEQLRVSWGEYDSVLPEAFALSQGGAAEGQAVDAVVLVPWLRSLLSGDERPVGERVAELVGDWSQVWGVLARQPGVRILQVGLDAVQHGPHGVHAGGLQGEIALARQGSAALREALPPGAWFVDLERIAGDLGRRAFYDQRQYHWAKQPFSEAGLVELSRHLVAGLRALTTGPRKVLVLDLDNTLWGGVVGEEGPLGVRLGDDAEGEAFRTFQAWCKGLTRRGVLLCVASKNNEADAKEPFEKNPAMVLGLDDFAAFSANWQPKSENIRAMAAQLNLGLDSFVFVDDNPAERELVRQARPEVHVVELPEDPAAYVAAVEAGLYFETQVVTEADKARAAQYKAEASRRAAQSSFTDLSEYHASLGMTGEARAVDEGDLPRVVQLVGKTNQFNLTTRRHTREQVAAWAADPGAVCLSLRVTDRFGDHGLVSVILAVPLGEGEAGHDPERPALRVDTWLMSCRVIARTVEEGFFCTLVEQARARGVSRLVGEFRPSAKNSQVAELWERLGGVALEGSGEELRRWVVDLDATELPRHFVGGLPGADGA